MGRPLKLRHSSAIPVPFDGTLEKLMAIPLPELFRRRAGAIAAVKKVTGQDGPWTTVGQTRTIVFKDRSTMYETLTAVDAPTSFSYRIDPTKGPLKKLVDHVEGKWEVVAAGTGSKVTWTWIVHPRNRAGAVAKPVLKRQWKGVARKAFEDLERSLMRP